MTIYVLLWYSFVTVDVKEMARKAPKRAMTGNSAFYTKETNTLSVLQGIKM